ncbi:MAG: RsmD family RNA methyltransferase [Chitinophagaceae bacterium]
MRIINGKYGGRIFNLNISSKTRPTSNFAKEALFNILNNDINFCDIYALDLFAGIGSIGFEFSSLGVLEVKMIDESRSSIEILRKISQILKTQNVKIEKSEVFKFLEKNTIKYNIIFADPPYNFKHNHLLINTILKKEVLSYQGVFVLEHYKKYSFQNISGFVEVRNYGDSSFSFFKK